MPRNKTMPIVSTGNSSIPDSLQAESDKLAALIPNVVKQCGRELHLADCIFDHLHGVQNHEGEPTPLPPGVDKRDVNRHLLRVGRVREMLLRAAGLASSAPQNTYVLAQINGPQASPITPAVLAALGVALQLPAPHQGVIEAELIGNNEG